MKIDKIVLGYISENCYLVSSDEAAIVIDPGIYDERIQAFLFENRNKQRMIILTHCHFDHIGGAKKLAEKNNIKIGIGQLENTGLNDSKINLSENFGCNIEPFSADVLFEDNKIYKIGDVSLKVIFTPGHTAGSVSYLIENSLFSGDMLFKESYGRTDFITGSISEMKKTFYKLMNELNGDIIVYPGHGEKTTISHEKEYNPINYMSVL